MPLYDLRCAEGHSKEFVQTFDDTSIIECEFDGLTMHRSPVNMFSVAGRGEKRYLRDQYFSADLEHQPYRSQRDVARAKERARQVDALTN